MPTCDRCLRHTGQPIPFHLWQRVYRDDYTRGDVTHLESHWRTDRHATAFICDRCSRSLTAGIVGSIFVGVFWITVAILFFVAFESGHTSASKYWSDQLGEGEVLLIAPLGGASVTLLWLGAIRAYRSLSESWLVLVDRDTAPLQDRAWKLARERILSGQHSAESSWRRFRRKFIDQAVDDLDLYFAPLKTKSTLLRGRSEFIGMNAHDHVRLLQKLYQ